MINISVIVPFYNSEQYIQECIEALLHQEYPTESYEILMVDNNSTDASAEIVKRYPKIKLISEMKQGAYAARNRALREAKGKIIAFTDPDCIPADDWLQRITEAMLQTNVGLVIGSYETAEDSLALSILESYEHEKKKYIFTSKLKELYYGYANNMAVRKKVFNEIGPFVEKKRGADVILVRLLLERYSFEAVCYCPEIRVRHREVDNLTKLYRKFFIYWRGKTLDRHFMPSRRLSNKERVQIIRRTVESQKYSWTKSVYLVVLLTIGQAYSTLGIMSGAWSSKGKIRKS